MATFGLVHGAWHGAWCWERLIPLLEAQGHRAVAVDLPCDDPTAGCARYAEVADGTLPRVDDLVVVGHSLGGLTIPLVAARRPVRTLVFLCGAVPLFGQSFEDQGKGDPSPFTPDYATGRGRTARADGTVVWTDAAAVTDAFYHDATPEDARWAIARLRPQAVTPRREPCPLVAWPPATRVSILCRDDHAVSAEWSRRVARDRLGVTALEMPGSHSPFLSRPGELATLLDRVVRASGDSP